MQLITFIYMKNMKRITISIIMVLAVTMGHAKFEV